MKRYILALAAVGTLAGAAQAAELLNVSYDPTRELYTQLNDKFIADWKAKSGGEELTIKQSHGGSSAQSRKIIDGLEADVATLGIASDIDVLADKGLLPADWQKRLPGDSTPYNSTIILLVRKGNPKGIKDWGDLVKPGIAVITPNPKTSAGARWNFLAAWAYALKTNANDESKARAWIGQLYKNVPVLDTGARGATLTFAQRGLGDVLIAWENEAHLALKEFGEQFEIVIPSLSILAQPPVAVVDKNAKKHGTEQVAEEYLNFFYTSEVQELAAQNYFRPLDATVAARHAKDFPKIELTTIQQFGGWKAAQPKLFGDGGVFDQIYNPKP